MWKHRFIKEIFMLRFKGRSVYSAIAIGKARVLKKDNASEKMRKISDPVSEIERFLSAKESSRQELSEIYEKARRELGEANAQIFNIHLMMLDDEDFCDAVTEIIRRNLANAEYAVARASESFEYLFSSMDDEYLRSRATDIRDISSRIISHLSGRVDGEISEDTIICAHDLTPSETVSLDISRVKGFLCAQGSPNSHTSILARSIGIPAIIGLGGSFIDCINDGDLLCINGYTGEVLVRPEAGEVLRIKALIREDTEKRELLKKLKGKETKTIDGRRVLLYANIGDVQDVAGALVNDAEGIGLFRSEFIFLGRDTAPSENEQFEIYKTVLEAMGGKRVIIRTLDIGADKQVSYLGIAKEENPALGLRGIRLCLTHPEVFKAQLRALIRASSYGRLAIMFPMITSEAEIFRIKDYIADVKAELLRDKIPFCEDFEIGIMIETPASAIISDRLAPLVDFFSVGTNDLTQYTLAVDRQNSSLDDFCDTHSEAVLRLIEYSATCIHKCGGWIGICGELASDISLTSRFLKMGIDELSVSPSFVLKVRDTIRKIDLSNE